MNMFFNPIWQAPHAAAQPLFTHTQFTAASAPTSTDAANVTVLTSRGSPANKQFSVDENGEVVKTNYGNGFLYTATSVSIGNIEELADLIDRASQNPRHLLIRGEPINDSKHPVRRLHENFPEPETGCRWVMLDFDGIELQEGMDPLSAEVWEAVIQYLPEAFHNVSYYYQFSAGILQANGEPLKPGFSGHLFFWFTTPVPGKPLAAWLNKHNMDTGFYRIGEDRAGGVKLDFGVDPATIRSCVQPHYIAAPTISTGVICLLPPEKRQGLVRKASDSVELPTLPDDIEFQAHHQKRQLTDRYKIEYGYARKTRQTQINGKVALTHHYEPPGERAVRGGRCFVEGKLSQDSEFLTLYFEEEGSPGSWYVAKGQPQIGRRHGDGSTLPLKELSLGAHEYVRDQLGWFQEIPHVDMALTAEGYLPSFSDFAKAKVSFILAPTGTGKTRAAIDWAQEQTRQGHMMLYAAPTIPLVDQMRDGMKAQGLEPHYYSGILGPNFPSSGIIVTTNETLPKLLEEIYNQGKTHALVFDEIHWGLDDFMRSEKRLAQFEGALAKARQALLMTGTVTDVQRNMVVETVKQANGGISPESYCCYEFPAAKRNPLEIRETASFDSDLGCLLSDFQAKLAKGEPLPRFVLLLDVSKMEAYRKILMDLGLAEQAIVVSRPENDPTEIEAARTSQLPILISSPLFGIGLNFERQPDILWARFDHVNADTNQIVQTVNRANRGKVQAEVRIYGKIDSAAYFPLPQQARLKQEISDMMRSEASCAGLLEQHFQLDRIAYNELRKVERKSTTALSILALNDGIQNFVVRRSEESIVIDKQQASVVKDARKAAKAYYGEAIAEAASRRHCNICLGIIWLEDLANERRMNWKSSEYRTDREFQTEAAGIVMSMLRLAEPGAASTVDTNKLFRLLGEKIPWLSGQYDTANYAEWAKVAAEKTEKLIVLLTKLGELRAGEISAEGLSASLTRNKLLAEAFIALAGSESEFLTMTRKFEQLTRDRAAMRNKGSGKDRAELAEKGLAFLAELLRPLGITYGKKEAKGRQVTDLTQPIVPATFDFEEMALILKRQVVRLRALPSHQQKPVEPPRALMPGDFLVPRQVCENCVFFHQNDCVQGIPMDWQSASIDDQKAQCHCFKRIKDDLLLH